MSVVVLAALAFLLAGGTARAQATAGAPPVTAAAPAAPSAAAAGNPWSCYASAYAYLLPDDVNYIQPTLSADRGRLHLEGRFNYEDLDTGSAWLGYNISAGETLTLEFTPMLGAVFGNTNGVAPGYKGALGWRMLQLSSEGEYVFDAGSSADSFLYMWSELEVAPADWWRFGLVLQRTKVYETDIDVQRGFFAGVSFKGADTTVYVFNPDADRPTVVVTVGVGF